MSEKQSPAHIVSGGNTVQGTVRINISPTHIVSEGNTVQGTIRINISPTLLLKFNEETGEKEAINMVDKSRGNTLSAERLEKKES